jgi:UDP-N-acetylglucosamine 2-epimerase (non-hydrolysing)
MESPPGSALRSRPRLLEPLGYIDFLALMDAAALVLTDSGGVQEETTVLGTPCLTVRDTTERPVTVTHGTNTLVDPYDERAIVGAALAALDGGGKALGGAKALARRPPLWDGRAGERIAAEIAAFLAAR